MSQFSNISKERLKTCHSDLQVLFNRVIEEIDITIVCGHRNEEEQNKAYQQGNSKLRWSDSKHNTVPSLAVDVVSYESGHLDWGVTQSAYLAGRIIGIASELFREGKMKHRIRPGVDWDNDNDVDDTKFFDAPHFEIIPNL
jgi:peptidoglycan L-alanyl-D-glutamate endopeptidase CwlK